MRILLAEDELPLARAIGKILEKNNYSQDTVNNGEDALNYILFGNYDAVVLDIMMPKLDGLSVLRRVREEGITIPILILSARSEIEDRVAGLDCGANDYLPKPFDSRELLARIRAMTRTQPIADNKLRFSDIALDRAAFMLSGPLGEFSLTNKEYQMMEMLIENPGRIISAEHFIEKIWGYDSDVEINVVWVYISYLRKKLSALGATAVIKASRNAGYSLVREDD